MSKKEIITNKTDTFGRVNSSTETTNQSLNVWQKLVAVRKTIGYIKKGAQGYGYKYAKESDVLLAMAEEMNNQGLVLEQVPLTFENVNVVVKTKTGYITTGGLRIKFQYIITDSDNPSDQIIREQYIQNHGEDAQTIGSLMTYGMKYFLFKTFNIAMDEYDIDAIDKDKVEYAPIQQPVYPKITPNQVKVLKELIEKAKCKDSFYVWIESKFGIKDVENLLINNLDEVSHSLNQKIAAIQKEGQLENSN